MLFLKYHQLASISIISDPIQTLSLAGGASQPQGVLYAPGPHKPGSGGEPCGGPLLRASLAAGLPQPLLLREDLPLSAELKDHMLTEILY